MPATTQRLDELAINTLRILSADAVQNANSGHPGMAIAEAWLAARYNRPGHTIVDHYTYAICGDGDLMEGVTQEAASLAGHLRLGKLIYLYDQNYISLSGATSMCFSEDVARRFDAYGWHTRNVPDGNGLDDIAAAIEEAQRDPRP